MVNVVLTISLMAFEFAGILAPQSGLDDNATIESVSVRFDLPKGDNKDDNTSLTVEVKKGNSLIAAKYDFANAQEFNDPGHYGPYSLDVKTKITRAEFRGSTTILSIQPHGGREHDTVIMNTIVEVNFSDGTVLISESGIHRYENASSYTWNN